MKYIAKQARELIELLRAGTGPMRDLIDFSLLKFREKDALEEVLRSYCSDQPCDIAKLRDQRLRHFFGTLHFAASYCCASRCLCIVITCKDPCDVVHLLSSRL